MSVAIRTFLASSGTPATQAGLRRDFRAESGRDSGTIFIGNPLCPRGITCGKFITYSRCCGSVYSKDSLEADPRLQISVLAVPLPIEKGKSFHTYIYIYRFQQCFNNFILKMKKPGADSGLGIAIPCPTPSSPTTAALQLADFKQLVEDY
jgi:hypothetical protein